MISTEHILKLIEKGQEVLKTSKQSYSSTYVDEALFTGWRSQVLHYLEKELPHDSRYIKDFDGDDYMKSNSPKSVNKGICILNSINEDISSGNISLENKTTDFTESLINIFEKFRNVARQLRHRHNNRSTIDIKDEYDVQDLLHSLLHLYFEDIRPEEWTPSYAGNSSRMDFLLKDNKTVIEVKKTRRGLTAKEIGKQLIDDIARYKVHPDCEKLICFVYDPEGLISNPRGIENDLSKNETLDVKVIIRP